MFGAKCCSLAFCVCKPQISFEFTISVSIFLVMHVCRNYKCVPPCPVQVQVSAYTSFVLALYLEVKWLDHVLTPCLTIQGTNSSNVL